MPGMIAMMCPVFVVHMTGRLCATLMTVVMRWAGRLVLWGAGKRFVMRVMRVLIFHHIFSNYFGFGNGLAPHE